MSKKRRFRTFFDSQHAKGSETLPKSTQEHFRHIFQSLWQRLSWKMSLLVISEILGVLVNSFTADDKYSLCNSENSCNQFKCNYLRNKKIFSILCCISKMLENVSLSDMWSLSTVCEQVTVCWLQMKSILFVILSISHNQFKCNYLRSKKRFLNFS